MSSVDFQVVNDWGNGFTANIVLTNQGSEVLDNWTLGFDAPFDITAIWGGSIATQSGNSYLIENASWNGKIAPGKSVTLGFNGRNPDGNTTAPSNYSFNGETPSQPLPQLSVGDISVLEGNGIATFTINLSEASEQNVSVDYTTLPGTATAQQDYSPLSGTAIFTPGETTHTVMVSMLDDSIYEGEETYTLQLSNSTNATLQDPEAIATIIDDDPPPITDTPVEFVVNNDWGTGFVAEIRITNNTSEALENWNLSLEAPYDIEQLWNAQMIQTGDS